MKRLVALLFVIALLLNVTCVYAESGTESVSYYVDETVPEPVSHYVDEAIPEPVKTEAVYEDITVSEPVKNETTYVDENLGNSKKDEAHYVDDTPASPVKDESHYVDDTLIKPVTKPTAKPTASLPEEPAEYEDFEPATPVKSESTHVDENYGSPVKDEADYTDDIVGEPVRDNIEYTDSQSDTPVETPKPQFEEIENTEDTCEHDIYLHSQAKYEESNKNSHTWYDTTIAYCKMCGEEFSSETTEQEERHHFDSSGTCRECGYHKHCDHENERQRYLGTTDSEYYNQHYHLAVTTTEVYCGSCGETLYENEYEEYTNHVMENGRCIVCDKQLYVIPEVNDEEEISSSETITAKTIVLHINDNIGYCDGNQVMWNVTPKLQNNKTMVPLKQLMQMVGGEFVEWDAQNKSATFWVNGKYLTYTAGKKNVEGSESSMENPAKIVDNTMYVELTAVVTETDYRVSFYDNYCVIAKDDLAKEVVHDYATTYYGADFSYKAPQVSNADRIQLKERMQEFRYIISSAKTAYENGTISQERLKEILDYVEKNLNEYEEVIDGTRKLQDVSEKESNYKAVSGSTGNVVEETQRQLQELGYTSQDITGRYDDATFNNVLYFQITNGLETTGWLDSATRKALREQSGYGGAHSSIKHYSVRLDENEENIIVDAIGNENVDKISVNIYCDAIDYSNSTITLDSSFTAKYQIPYTLDFNVYEISITSYNDDGTVIESIKSFFSARRRFDKGFNDYYVEDYKKANEALLIGIAAGAIKNGVVEPAVFVSQITDYFFDTGSLEEEAQAFNEFVLSNIDKDKQYYYYVGELGGRIYEYTLEAAVMINGVTGIITNVVTDPKTGATVAEVTFDNGSKALVTAVDDSDNVVVATSKYVDDVVYKNMDDGLNFSNTAYQHFRNPDRFVSMQMLIDTIKTGSAAPDPQGVAGLVMYYKRVAINGKKYNLEVLYEAATNTVKHFKYDTKALAPLSKIID